MTSDHAPNSKVYTGHNRPNLFFDTSISSLVQPFLSTIFLMVLWGSCLLFTAWSGCVPKKSYLSEGMEPPAKVSELPRYTTRCIGSVTILGRDGPVRRRIYQPIESRKVLSKIGSLLSEKGCIAPQHLIPPLDDTIPHWEKYGLTYLMPCQGPILNDTHTFSLDLDGARFQNGEQLGFMLVQPKGSPVHLVKHLLEKCLLWPNDLPLHIADYLILPGLITKQTLQDSNRCKALTHLHLNSSSTLYCYIKQDQHYCFIPLENIVPEVKTTYSVPIRFSKSMPPTSLPAPPSSLENSLATLENSEAALPVDPLSLKQGEPSLPIINGSATEGSSMRYHPSAQCGLQNLCEELKAAGYPLPGIEMGHNSALLETAQEVAIAHMKQDALSRLLKNVNTFKTRQENVRTIIERTNIVLSNDVAKSEVRLGVADHTELALCPALEAIRGLQTALQLEKGYQAGIEYSRPINLSAQRSAVIRTLNNLEEAIDEEYGEVLSVDKSLTLVIEYLGMIYDLLLELFKLDEIDDMERNVKQLFMGSGVQLTKARAIIEELEQMTFAQQTVARKFRGSLVKIEDILEGVRKELAASVGDPLKTVKNKIIGASNLKCLLRINILVVEGKAENLNCMQDILTNLELAEKEIAQIPKIFNSKDLKSLKVAIAKKIEEAFNQAIELENTFQSEIRSQGEIMNEWIERFEPLLPNIEAP